MRSASKDFRGRSLLPFALFAVGVVAVIWATERLLEGLVGLAWRAQARAYYSADPWALRAA